MIDSTTNQPVHVSSDGDAGPYVMVPVDQLDRVTAALDASAVPYWADDEAISINGRPAVAVVNLGRDIDAATVQSILDDIP